MKQALMIMVLALAIAAFGCGGGSGGAGGNGVVNYTPNPAWPAAVNNLGRLIAQEQRNVVRPGGTVDNPGYSSAQQAQFDGSNQLQKIVNSVESTSTFTAGVAALKTLPAAMQQQVLTSYSQPIDPTWAQTGQIGNGTTDAGQAVETEIATALSNAVSAAL